MFYTYLSVSTAKLRENAKGTESTQREAGNTAVAMGSGEVKSSHKPNCQMCLIFKQGVPARTYLAAVAIDVLVYHNLN